MGMLSREIALGGAARPCSRACGVGAAEVVLLRQVLGLCLRLSVRLSGDCPGVKAR